MASARHRNRCTSSYPQEAGAGKRKEATPVKHGKTEREAIRPARTAIAHAMGGNKGK
jgi:hypothetical protein